MALSSAASITKEEVVPIVKQNLDVGFDGTYVNAFETGNGIVVEEHGVLKNAGVKDAEAQEVIGSVSYTAPDGTPVSFKYIANENGYHVEGSHLPVGPAVPAAIARALAWIEAHPKPEEKETL